MLCAFKDVPLGKPFRWDSRLLIRPLQTLRLEDNPRCTVDAIDVHTGEVVDVPDSTPVETEDSVGAINSEVLLSAEGMAKVEAMISNPPAPSARLLAAVKKARE